MSNSPFRIVIRQDGPKVNMSYALPDTMDKAIHIATIDTVFLHAIPGVHEAFVKFGDEVAKCIVRELIPEVRDDQVTIHRQKPEEPK